MNLSFFQLNCKYIIFVFMVVSKLAKTEPNHFMIFENEIMNAFCLHAWHFGQSIVFFTEAAFITSFIILHVYKYIHLNSSFSLS